MCVCVEDVHNVICQCSDANMSVCVSIKDVSLARRMHAALSYRRQTFQQHTTLDLSVIQLARYAKGPEQAWLVGHTGILWE